MNSASILRSQLRICRVNLDTGRENVAVISRRSSALRPDVFRGFSRVELRSNSKILLATLLITEDDTLVGPDDLGLAEPALRRFGEPVGSLVTVTPAVSPASLDAVRAKIGGRTLSAPEIGAIIDDLAHYRYSDMEIAAFLVSSASFMTVRAMSFLRSRMQWLRRERSSSGTGRSWSISIASVESRAIGRL